MKKIILIGFTVLVAISAFSQGNRWSEKQIRDWYNQNDWFCGVNYIPSNAINYTAMWDKTSFSPDLIDKEMKLAAGIGINCARVVLQYAVYADSPKYFLKTLDQFLAICSKYGIKVMPCFFDDCSFGVNGDPVIGKQVEPLIGWYAWGWSPSPGHSMVIDHSTHPKLEKYVKEVMTKFKNDQRIFIWDLYNEPTNDRDLGFRSLPLVGKVFKWAREINPSQPLTIAVWNDYKELNDIIFNNSDIITFHCYSTREKTQDLIDRLKTHERPIICSEWMNRPMKSTIAEILPLLKKNNVGSLLWGLVNGKTQTQLPWGFKPENLPYTGPWQHDLYTIDLKPYDESEIKTIKELTLKNNLR